MEATGVSSSLTPEQTAAQAPDFGPQMPLSEKLLAIAIRAQNFTGASGVAVAIKEGDEVVCRASWGTSAPEVGVRLRDQNSFTYQCMRAGVAMRCDDASCDPRVDSVACSNLGISSIAVAPVGHGDHVSGVIAAFSEEPHAFTETHIVVLTTLGEVVAKFLKDEPSLAAGALADEPVAPNVGSSAVNDSEPLGEIAPEAPPASVSPLPAEVPPVAEETPASTLKTAEVHTGSPVPPVAPAETRPEPPVPAVPILSSLLASARSKLPKGAFEKDPEIKPEEMRPPADVPSAPGLVSSAEQISSPQKGFRAKSAGEKPSAAAKPFMVPDKAQEKPALATPSFGIAPGLEWNNVLHSKFLIPVGAAAVLVFALVTWTFHSFRSRHVTPPAAPAIEQPAETAPAQTPEPAELTSSAPATNTVMDVSVKAATIEKPAAPKNKPTAEKPAGKPNTPAPVLETTAEVRSLNSVPVAPERPEAAPPPSLALVEVPPQLPALKAAVPSSTVVGPSVSHLVPSKLLQSPAPVYPDTAKRFHMTGTVVLAAKIGSDGKVKSINVLSGPALFRASAIAAVKVWRYRPATLDGQPVESTAEITLNFAEPR